MDPGDSGKMLVGLYLCYKLYSLCVCSVAQLCLTLCDPIDCSPPGSSVHGILQARTLEWVAISSSKGSSWPRNKPASPAFAGRFFYHWAAQEALFLTRAITNKVVLNIYIQDFLYASLVNSAKSLRRKLDYFTQILWENWKGKKPLWKFFKKLSIHLPNDPTILLLGIYPREMNKMGHSEVSLSLLDRLSHTPGTHHWGTTFSLLQGRVLCPLLDCAFPLISVAYIPQ